MQRLKPRKGVIIEIPNDSPIYDKNQPQSNTEQEIGDSLNSLTEAYQYHPDYGKIVGEHKGAHYFTIGQRKGLGVGGTPEPLFIIDTDTKNNIIYTGQGDQHKGLYRKGLFVKNTDIHWIREDLKLKSNTDMAVKARIRYRQDLEKARIHQREDGLYVIFDKPQRGVTPGQFVAWYLKDELLGSGIIY
jgi:tRNA-specific 2-thiouridylase